MKGILFSVIAIGAVLVAGPTRPARANVIYDFREDGTGTVLAEIELQTLPAGLSDIASYHLTSAGDAIFHLGTGNLTFNSFFVSFGNQIVDDGAGGLAGNFDYAPGVTLSSIYDSSNDLATGFYGGRDDFMEFLGTEIKAEGNYVLVSGSVPEPPTLALLLTGVVGLGFYAWRRQCDGYTESSATA